MTITATSPVPTEGANLEKKELAIQVAGAAILRE
jgi:hypothetical protein